MGNDMQLKLWPEDTLRGQAQRVMISARDCQLQIARKLHAINHGGDWNEWGYDSLEQYCECEPHIRMKFATAKKYIIAYEYGLKRNLLESESAPDIGTLYQLSKIKKHTEIDENKMKEIECSVMDMDEKDAVKEIKTQVKPREKPINDDASFERILRGARKMLDDMMSCHKIPDTVIDDMKSVVKNIEAVS